jgi:hypothetical protein
MTRVATRSDRDETTRGHGETGDRMLDRHGRGGRRMPPPFGESCSSLFTAYGLHPSEHAAYARIEATRAALTMP